MNKNKFEIFALNEVFHSWPMDLSFKEIKDLILNDNKLSAFNDALENTINEDQQLIVCEQFEDEPNETLVGLLESIKHSAQLNFN